MELTAKFDPTAAIVDRQRLTLSLDKFADSEPRTASRKPSLPDSPRSEFTSHSTIDNVQRNVEQWFQRVPHCPTAS
jgi:hypothetical protein